MCSDVNRHPLGFHLQRRQSFGQRNEGSIRTGDDTKSRCVDRSHIEVARHIYTQVRFGHGHGEHATRSNGVEKLAAQKDKPNAIFKAHHPRQGGGSVFTHRMADQGSRRDTPTFIKLCQRVFGNHDEGQLHRGLFQHFIGSLLMPFSGQPQVSDGVIQLRLQDSKPFVHPVRKNRFGLIQIAGHAGILGATAGKHKDDLRSLTQEIMVKHAARVSAFQKGSSLLMAFGHDHPALFKSTTAFFQGVGHICQRLLRMGTQIGGKAGGLAIKCCLGAG